MAAEPLPVIAATVKPGLLLDARAAAAFVGIADRTFSRWLAGGALPDAVEVGGRRRWRRTDLERWVAWGCPPARKFRAMVAGGRIDTHLEGGPR